MNERNYGLDLLRVLACYMVIQVHSGEFYYINGEGHVINDAASCWVGWLNSLCRTAVPLFVMLSGFFLLPVKEKMGTFFKKRFIRVVVPFVVWCVLYAFYQVVRGQADVETAFINVLKIPVNFGVDVGHLWYVYMLIGLYMFAPIVSPWLEVASRKGIEFYLYVWTFCLFLPYIHLVFPAVLGECFWNRTPMLYYFSGFLGYMVLAFYIRKYWMERKAWNVPVGLVLIVAGYFVSAFGFVERLKTVEFVWDTELTWGFETINIAMMSLGIFLIFKNIRLNGAMEGLRGVVADISKLSYGIYLVHIMLLNLFYDLLNTRIDCFPVKMLTMAVCTFVASYLVVKVLSWLPKSKYIVG